MPSFSDLHPGQAFDGPSRTITESLLTTMTSLGGYTHPLFTDHTYVESSSPFESPPAPGALVLFILGGLAESSPAFDHHTVALLGFDEVRFLNPVTAGTTLRSSFEVLETHPSDRSPGGTVLWSWRAADQRGRMICDAKARMLVRDADEV